MKETIYDIVRKKNVILTPEEWVRQQLLHYLINVKKYPTSLISVEKQIKIGALRKRYDIVVYVKDKPWMIIECKAENEPLNNQVVQQVMSYCSVLPLQFVAISNGKEIKCYHIVENAWQNFFPEYESS